MNDDEEPIGVFASDGSLAYNDDPSPANVLPLPPDAPAPPPAAPVSPAPPAHPRLLGYYPLIDPDDEPRPEWLPRPRRDPDENEWC